MPSLPPARVRSSRPGYGVLRGVGVLVAAVMITGSSLSLVPSMARQEATSVQALEGASLDTLEETGTVLVEGGRGDVVVREIRAGESPTVTLNSRWSFREPELRVGQGPDEQLVVSAPCPGGNWGNCAADVELSVPPGTAVEVRASLGDVDIISTGDVTVLSSMGDVTVGGDPGQVEVQTDLGDIQVSGTPQTVLAEASLGTIRVQPQEPPALVSATTSLGDVHLEMPGGVSYAVDSETSLGDEVIRVSRDPAAPHTLRARTSLGTIRMVPVG
ncbi:DUF4097 family beta strand repeat-containing protein [Ornithinimicrobium pratense]|uniref:DUF4097 domain-containing protein n=1 Tax=Ornithinimicrobium pratense TaxID=2593973 RepID=A0A5J6V376_9MICO|nr:DUF4097 family beta strand repeat-containing protein [Ornithinimicrobium pratense]QFG67393.1 DUF4097 domain-containing protein [Ornithinimicrobium pratense]